MPNTKPIPTERDPVRAALADCRAYLVTITTPSRVGPYLGVISSYHPCHALIDKIDEALNAPLPGTGEPSLNQEAAETQYAPNPRDVFAVPFPQTEQPIAWTNKAQLGFLKDPTCVDIPMAMWGRTSTMSPIPLYALPPTLNSGADQEALDYATRLLTHFVAEHFPHNPNWRPQTTLIGVLMQLDNATTIIREYKEKITALPRAVEGGAVGREAIIEECAKIAETAYSRMFPKPANRITAENAGHAAAREIRALTQSLPRSESGAP